MSVKLSPCDDTVFKRGRVVFLIAGPRAWIIELWVRLLAALTATHTDWSYFGGRAVVKTLGDPVRVRAVGSRIMWLLPGSLWYWWEDMAP